MSRSPTEALLLTASGVRNAQGQAWPDFAAWCAAHPGARVALRVGAERMHSLLVPSDLPLADEAALLGYVRLQFTHYFGPAAQAWPLAAWARGACALAEGSVAELQAAAAAHRVKLVSLRPSWTLAPARDGRFTVRDDQLLTQLRREGGRLVELQQRHADDSGEGESEAVTAQALLAEPGGQPGPDFIPQPSRTRPLVWAWAAAAGAACALVAVQAQGQHEEGQRLAEQAAMLDRLARQAQPAPAAKAPNPATRARAWAAAQQLNTDWPTRWAELERALPPGLQLSGLDLDAKALRLEGQAAEAGAVTQLVDRLALQAAPGEEVVLTRLQRPDAAADAGQLRFELMRRPAGGLR